jgi:peptide-methionine (S)-S-oxide reductase
VIRTRVGYAGGEMEGPNYGNIGDHTETVQVDFDPGRISYNQLLKIFWDSHRPTSRNGSRQYMNAIFYHDDEQRRLAMDSKTAVEQKNGGTIISEVLPLRSFTMAENYHQKYMLKQHSKLKDEFSYIYPKHQDFVASTAVARLNGYAGGNGTRDQLSRELETLGLSTEGKRVLSEMAGE